MMCRSTIARVLLAAALIGIATLAGPASAHAADYVPFLPDTTSFVYPFTGQVHHFLGRGQCLEVSQENLDNEDYFLGSYVQYQLTQQLLDKVETAADALGSTVPPWHVVAGAAAGWSFPDSIHVRFAVVDTSSHPYVLYGVDYPFTGESSLLPPFPDPGPQDTTAVQQVNLALYFAASGKQETSSHAMSVESTSNPESRVTGHSTIDIFDVSDKRMMKEGNLPDRVLFTVTNTGTLGCVGFQAPTGAPCPAYDAVQAVNDVRAKLTLEWEQLRQHIYENQAAILAEKFDGGIAKTPCADRGGLRVFVHDVGTTCDQTINNNCVIYGTGDVLGLPDPTGVALATLAATAVPGEIRLVWSAAGLTTASYDIYRAETARPGIERRITPAPLAGGPDFEFVDRDVAPGVEYAYTISEIDASGAETRFGPLVVRAAGVARFALAQNAPNPFNPLTSIAFEVPTDAGRTVLRIHDAQGRTVRTLVNASLAPGSYRAEWNGLDDGGAEVPSGVYFYAIEGMGDARKMVLQK